MPVKKKTSKKVTKTTPKTVSRGRPAKKIDYEAPLLEVFEQEPFVFDPEDGWDDLDRDEALTLLREKYDKTIADIISDCFEADPEMDPKYIITFFHRKLNLEVDRQYIYTSKMRWKRSKEFANMRKGIAVPADLGASGDLLPSLADLVKRHGVEEVETALRNLKMVASMLGS